MSEILALALTISGCVFLYLANPNQQWLARSFTTKPALVAGSLLLAAGLASWSVALRPLAGFFVTLDVAMVCLVAFPCIAAARAVLRGR